MNPLPPFTFCLCHRRRPLLRITLVSLATATLFILAGVLDTIPTRANVSYLTKLSRVIRSAARSIRLEYTIAAVAAIALATLNHRFLTQRKEESGILNAIGHSRRWLALRTMKETGGMAGIAWGVGAAVCRSASRLCRISSTALTA